MKKHGDRENKERGVKEGEYVAQQREVFLLFSFSLCLFHEK
jgi:hypothetical protein